jgi:hypothetical protein
LGSNLADDGRPLVAFPQKARVDKKGQDAEEAEAAEDQDGEIVTRGTAGSGAVLSTGRRWSIRGR